eukprot:Nitzschia sp. Nitz4//scaffold22_size323478//215839//216987//NITZ4_000560-RA/size323478-processed-gene-0.416-mRNA-1//1//CDS//3329543094//2000//frame0
MITSAPDKSISEPGAFIGEQSEEITSSSEEEEQDKALAMKKTVEPVDIESLAQEWGLSDLLSIENLTLSKGFLENVREARTFWEGNGGAQQFVVNEPTKNNSMLHFISHIPKTGMAGGIRKLGNIVRSDPRIASLEQFDRFRPCDVSKQENIAHRAHGEYKNRVCTLWMSEMPAPPEFTYAYTMVREPRQHVISQFFHCTESKPHRGKAKYMPSTMDEWLEFWVNVTEVNKEEVTRRRAVDPLFKCYDPRNHQTMFTEFQLPANNDIEQAKADLFTRFNVLGDMAKYTQSLCVIVIKYTGGVPPVCDCTNDSGRRRLNAHGVSHHGATYNTTKYQDSLIAKLTKWDTVLYDLVQEAFEEQLRSVEEEYQIRVCDSIDFQELI